jgi:hypothetical protein
VKLIRNIAFVFVITKTQSLQNLTTSAVKSIIHKQERAKRVSDYNVFKAISNENTAK